MHQQAVFLRIKLADDEFGEYDESEAVYELENRLRTALKATTLGECDGHEFGAGFATIYCYGPDAEVLLSECFAVIGDQTFARGSHLAVRSGPPGTPERRVELTDGLAV